MTIHYDKTVEKSAEENSGSGLAYVGKSLAAGVGAFFEGIGDLVSGTYYDIIGDKARAEYVYKKSKVGNWQQNNINQYNPSGAWKVAGDVAQGIGNSLPMMAISAIPVVGQGASLATLGVSATGSGIGEAVQTTGKLGAKEYTYGGLSALTEAVTEKYVGKTLEAGARIAGKTVKGGVATAVKEVTRKGVIRTGLSEASGEFAGEFISASLDPLWKNATGVDPNAKFDLKESLYQGAVGFLSGGMMSTASVGVRNAINLRNGDSIVKRGNAGTMISTANYVADQFKSENYKTAKMNEGITALKGTVNAYNALQNKTGTRAKMLLGEIQMQTANIEMTAGVMESSAAILLAMADPVIAQRTADSLSGLLNKTVTVDDIIRNKDGVLDQAGMMRWARAFVTPDTAERNLDETEKISREIYKPYSDAGELTAMQEGEATYFSTGENLSGGRAFIWKDNGKYNIALENDEIEGTRVRRGMTEAEVDKALKFKRKTAKESVQEKANGTNPTVLNHQKEGGFTIREEEAVDGSKQYYVFYKDGKMARQTFDTEEEARAFIEKYEANKDTAGNESTEVREVEQRYTAAEQDTARDAVKDFDMLPAEMKDHIIRMIRESTANGVSKQLIKFAAQTMSKRPGLRIRYKNGVIGNGFHADIVNGERVVVIKAKGINTGKALLHEFIHDVAKSAEYGKLRDYIAKTDPEGLQAASDNYNANHKRVFGKDAATDILEEEAVADYVSEHLHEEKYIKMLAGKNPGVLRRALRFMERFANKFRKTDAAFVVSNKLADMYSRALGSTDGNILSKERNVNSNSMQNSKKYSVTSDSDAVYLSAVRRGDTETAQRMVDTAAQTAGYIDSQIVERPEPEKKRLSERIMNQHITNKILLVDEQAGIEDYLNRHSVKDAAARIQFVRCANAAAQNAITIEQRGLDGRYLGESWLEIISPIAEDKQLLRTFEKYRTLLLHAEHMEVEGVPKPIYDPEIISAETARQMASNILVMHPEFDEIDKKMTAFINNSLDMSAEAGTIKKETAEYLKKTYPHYMTAVRNNEYDQSVAAVKVDQNFRVNDPIKNMKGDVSPLIEPLANTQKHMIQMVKISRMDKLASVLYDHADGKDVRIVEEIDEDGNAITDEVNVSERVQMVKAKNGEKMYEISLLKDGKRVRMLVSKNIYSGFDALVNRGSVELDIEVYKYLSNIMDVYKKMVTAWNPLFLARNLLKDLQDAILYTKFGFGTFIKAYFEAQKLIQANDPMWREYVAMGGLDATLFDYEHGITGKPGKHSLRQSEGSVIKQTSQKLENANIIVEQTPRFAEYLLTRRSGGTVEDALLNAADITTNFGRGGYAAKIANRTLMPFLNPAIQGADKFVRSWSEAIKSHSTSQIIALVLKSVAFGIVPLALGNLMYRDDDEYENMDDTVKENNYVFKLGETWVKIPRGRVLAVYAGLYNRTEGQVKGDYVDWKDYGQNVISQITPVGNITRTILSPFFDVSQNRTWYGSSIEPEGMQNIRPKDRYDENTSQIAIMIGQVTGASPKKIHYFMDQYSGVIGDILLPATSSAAHKNMVVAGFTVNAQQNSNLSDRFYKLYEETTYKKNDGDENAALLKRRLEKTKDAVSKMYDQISEIQKSNLSDSEKLAQINSIRVLINQLYKTMLDDKATFSSAVEATASIQDDYSVSQITAKNYNDLCVKQDSVGKYAVVCNGVSFAVKDTESDAKEYLANHVANTRYTEATRLVYGAESALKVYNESVYEKGTALDSIGIPYDIWYNIYTRAKYIKGNNREREIKEYIMALGMDRTKTGAIMYALGYTSYKSSVDKLYFQK